jgi:hypothetical protein
MTFVSRIISSTEDKAKFGVEVMVLAPKTFWPFTTYEDMGLLKRTRRL